MNNRIGLLLKVKDVTASKFAEMIGVQPSNISHILSGRNKPSLDFITKVVETFPDISLEWLMFGKGSMFQHIEDATTVLNQETNSVSTQLSETDENTGIPDLFSQDYLSENVADFKSENKIANIEFREDFEKENEPIAQESHIPEARSMEVTESDQTEKISEQSFQTEINQEEKQKTIVVQDNTVKNIPEKIILIYPDNTFEFAFARKKDV